jgi:glutathione-dependent peroxiredoxin
MNPVSDSLFIERRYAMFSNREGQRVPEVTFRARGNNDWVDITTAEVFKGKTVVLFALPGAFTPTCSSTHLPRYNELAPVFREHGVDIIACLSVNDGFVMESWSADQHSDNILFLPDGNADFTRGMGMLVDKRDLGFGQRSWRYSMLVRDGVIEKMFIEPDKPGDPFEVSDADTMLHYLAPQAEVPQRVTLFTKNGCAHCHRAKRMLDEAGLAHEEILLGRGGVSYRSLVAVSGRGTTPQVFIDGEHIGGADELEQWLRERDRLAAAS